MTLKQYIHKLKRIQKQPGLYSISPNTIISEAILVLETYHKTLKNDYIISKKR